MADDRAVNGAATGTRLYLVRHGATQLTAEDRFSGAEGVELSEEGRRQAVRLGERLRQEGITALYMQSPDVGKVELNYFHIV